ncbi:MAG TPA: hypothetical protein VEB19_06455 [Gemmatimonadaceae bacterium]|nr:hypothetical protein [Gemmatimonadaceae bacterium]
MNHVDSWRDAEIMSEAMRIARDPHAVGSARVFAIRHLMALLQPHKQFSFEQLVAGLDSTVTPDRVEYELGCMGALNPGRRAASVTPLPSGFEDRIKALLREISANESEPRAIRNAATCGITAVF